MNILNSIRGTTSGGMPLAAAADPKELLLLRDLLKDLPSSSQPRKVSNTLGAYARFLSLSKDSRSGLADEYFLLSLDCADCDPLTAHTYHWYQCTAKKDFRSVSKYEQTRARSPVAGCGETCEAAIRRLEATEDKTSAGYADSAACLACFLDEICGMPDKARPLYDEAMRIDPSNSFARGKFASFLGRNDGDKGLARKMFDEAIKDAPGNAEALVDYARFMWSAGEIDAADDMFKRAMSSVAEDSRVLGEYAAFKDGNGGDFVEVSSLYERSIAADSANSGALSRYAALLASRGDAVGAAGAYKRCYEADPKNIAGMLGLASVELERGNVREAQDLLKRAVDEHPEDAESLAVYAKFMENQAGDREAAKEFYMRALEANPGDADTLGSFAFFLAAEGKEGCVEEAERYFREAVAADPSNVRNLGRYAVFLEHFCDDPAASDEYYRLALEVEPDNAHNLANYAAFLSTSKRDNVRAGEMLERATAADPGNATVQSMRADYLENIVGDVEGADAAHKSAVSLDPTCADALGGYAGFLFYTRGDAEAASTFYRRALEQDEGHADHQGAYALCLMTLAKDRGVGEAAVLIEQADRSFRAALQLPGGKTPQNLGNYAVFLAHVRCSHAEAGSYFDQAIEADPSRAETLVNYAHFLEMCEQDDDRAQSAFGKALEVCGDSNAGLLGSYALFRCRTHEDDVDDNDALFKRTIAADPANGPNLAAYASFLSSVLGQNDQADILFRRAIEHCSHDATIIGAYASFVAEVLHDNDSAEVYFRRALEAEPGNTTNLGRYAYFLHAVRGDHHAADLHYQRAVRCGNDADILGNYATFLETEKDDYDAAEIYYKQAVAADPNHSYNLASYARFLAYTQNDNAAGFDFFSRAVASDLNDVAVLNFFIDFLQNIVESDANAPTYYRDAVTDFPQCSPLLQAYAEYLDMTGDKAEAAIYFKRASEIVTL